MGKPGKSPSIPSAFRMLSYCFYRWCQTRKTNQTASQPPTHHECPVRTMALRRATYLLTRRNKRQRQTLASGSGCATGPMDEHLGHFREVVVHDILNLGDVEPTCSHVCRNQNGAVVLAESLQVFQPLALLHVGMQLVNGEAKSQ